MEMSNCFSCNPTRILHVAVMPTFSFIAIVALDLRLVACRIQRTDFELNDYLRVIRGFGFKGDAGFERCIEPRKHPLYRL